MNTAIETPQETAKKVSPWAKIESPPILYSLEEVMSEQLADHLQNDELETIKDLKITEPELSDAQIANLLAQQNDTTCDNDLLLAQLLQLEMDKEYDEQLKSQEKLKNKNSRVAISYDKFKSVHPLTDHDEKELNRIHEPEVVTSEDSEDELVKLTFKNGVHGKGENMISKHDLHLSGRHNAAKIMNFPPEYDIGDSHGMTNGMRLSNKVFNELKSHSIHEKKYLHRINDKQDKSTNVFKTFQKTKI